MSSANRAVGDSVAQVPLAIVGIGCLFPKAGDAGAFWLNVKNGVDGIGPVPSTHWNPADYFDADPKAPDRTYATRGGFLDPVDFHPLDFGIAPKDLEATDTAQLLGLVAARQALTDAGYGPERAFDRDRVSVILGVTGTQELVIPLGARLGHPRWKKALARAGVPDETARQIIEEIGDSYVGWQENSFPGLLGNVVAGRIANRLDLGGSNCVVDAACASSLGAVHLAGMELATGRCDMAVTGGVDTFNDIFMFMCFSKTPALSPTGDSRPFDANGDGTILGEGLGIVVLKRLADAERDGDRVYAVIRGLGTSSDGKGAAIYAPVAAGQMKALRNAYEHAQVDPATIELVEAHGTGTRVGDGVEASALTEVYRQARPEGTWCALGSVKSQIGHTKAAAGAAGLIKAALALHRRVLPPTLKVREPIDALKAGRSPFYVNAEKRPWIARREHPRRAALSAFGFGGSNFHCVLEEHAAQEETIDWEGNVEIIALSNPTSEGLARAVESWRQPRAWKQLQRDAAASRARFSTKHDQRLLLVVNRETDVAHLAESAGAQLRSQPAVRSWRLPEGAYFGSGPASGKLAVLFPGQGSQYVGMLRDLACSFPALRKVLADANRVFARMTGQANAERLSDLIYPPAAFGKEERDEQEQRLRRTEVAQPAIGAVALGALQVLDGFGIRPDIYAGHSYGELPALCAAGCFDDEALHTISRLRGHLMASYHGDDAGSMLAVHAPLETIVSMLRDESLDLVVANRNAPAQSVLSGRRGEIERAAACFDRRRLRHTRLPVAAAFHSPLVAQAREPFRDALRDVKFQTAQSPVFANTTGDAYPNDPEAIRELLAGQLASPVDFVREIGRMAEEGVGTFLEVGPGSTLTKLVHSIMETSEQGPTADAFALDASTGKRSGMLDLAHSLARLAARGHSVELSEWERDAHRDAESDGRKPGLVIPICGANYVSPKTAKSSETSSAPTALTSPRVSRDAESSERSAGASNGSALRSEDFASRLTGTSSLTRLATSMQEKITPRVAPPTAGPAMHPESLSSALQITQTSLAAFQRLQEQTAQLHRQFLESQEAAQRTLQMLVEQQQTLLLGGAIAPALPVPPAVHRNGDSSRLRLNGDAPTVSGHQRELALAIQTPKARTEIQSRQAVKAEPARPDVSSALLAVVAEKTGYPVEMLTPEMSLDADLGIDSIKRVEIFSTLQERLPDAPVVKPEHLGSLQSLGDVIRVSLVPNTCWTATPVFGAERARRPRSARGSARRLRVRVAKRNHHSRQRISLPYCSRSLPERTGYPPEMLNAGMALDADLGIDSIKRVEIFSTLQERLPDAPVVKPEHLGSLHSLGDVAAFLANGHNGAPAKKKSPANSPEVNGRPPNPGASLRALGMSTGDKAPAPEIEIAHDTVSIERSVLRAVPLKRSSQAPVISLPSDAEVLLVADESAEAESLCDAIRKEGARVRLLSWNPDAAIRFDPAGEAGLILLTPPHPYADLPLRAFRWLRRYGPALREAAGRGGAILATIARLDGAFGLSKLDASRDVRAGALAGLAKTAALEWPTVACKALDLAPDFPLVRMAEVWHEIQRRGPDEVGITTEGLLALELKNEAMFVGSAPFASSDVVLLTGGARGVTAAVAIEVARRFQPTLVLFGRTALDAAEPAWLDNCVTETAIKQALARQLEPTPSPKAIEAEYRQLMARREALTNIAQMSTAGARVFYRALDVADAGAVQMALTDIGATVGPVTHVIHGAGVLADRRIEDVTDEQFKQVYATKVAGIEAILAALVDNPLKGLALFSSSTGRFGRVGQVAYAAANEVLNKIAQQQQRQRPDCKVVAINWGPWDGGMVTPALRKLFEKEGVATIPLRAQRRSVLFGTKLEQPSVKHPVETTVIARRAAARPALRQAFEQDISLRDYPVLRLRMCSTAGRFCRLRCTWNCSLMPPCTATPALRCTASTIGLRAAAYERAKSRTTKSLASASWLCSHEKLILVLWFRSNWSAAAALAT